MKPGSERLLGRRDSNASDESHSSFDSGHLSPDGFLDSTRLGRYPKQALSTSNGNNLDANRISTSDVYDDNTDHRDSSPRYGYDEEDDDDDDDNHGLISGHSRNRDRDHDGDLIIPSQTKGNSRLNSFLVVVGLISVLWVVISAVSLIFYRKYAQAPLDGYSPPWYPSPAGGTTSTWATSYQKAQKLVSQMTLAEKVNITTGTGWSMGLAVGNTGPAVNVGFPQLALQDGPLGVRFTTNSTAFPAGITVGATWNRDLMYARGKAHGLEARLKGINVLLSPCVGPLGRMPAGGRNWEGFGADPYLQGIAGAETLKGIQSEHVMATVKHFVANEQEHFRQGWEWALPNSLSSNVGDRVLHELYAWPFADAIKAGVASIMCSYNMVNNSYACGNSKLLNGILKDEMGFQGFVMSDWLAQRSGVGSTLAGLDMSMPGDGMAWMDGKSLWGSELSKSVLNGSVPLERINDMVTRIVAAWYQLGQDDETLFDRKGPNFSSWTDEKYGKLAPASPSEQELVEVNKFVDVQQDHNNLAREVAAEGTVLLKNEGILPLTRDGLTASSSPSDTPWSLGKVRIAVFGADAGPGDGPNVCPDRGCNQGTLASGWGSGAVNFPFLVTPLEALKREFDPEKVELTEVITNDPVFKKNPGLLDQDICIIFSNSDSGEGFTTWNGVRGDRNDLFLQLGGDELIRDVATGCGHGKGRTIVVIHSVGPVVMEKWIDKPGVHAVILANLPGEESGNALVDVLFGDHNPSGHLPYTIGKSLEDYGPDAEVMYFPNSLVPQQDFIEKGLYIDYRYFDKRDIEPRFEFGFGLSYTNFEFSNLVIEIVKEKSPFPAARPPNTADPPSYDTSIPDISQVLLPNGFVRLEKYIYPYLDTSDNISTSSDQYPYPKDYFVQQPLSEAGGAEGGNPDLWETHLIVYADVKNTGSLAGKAVPQLYLSYPETMHHEIDFPVRVLRGFDKVALDVGEVKTIAFNLTRRDLSYWNVHQQNWEMLVDGKYGIAVGESSRKLALKGEW
ncbi:hypothetical protein Cpir12675_003507 [Ceratocystis pirilliformis]|uniref:beta-glucosidase n=1 Tax=Ceratocystis pirilliformis TaxID=259994 RepID=A0ABR3Z3I7_9PEZI